MGKPKKFLANQYNSGMSFVGPTDLAYWDPTQQKEKEEEAPPSH